MKLYHIFEYQYGQDTDANLEPGFEKLGRIGLDQSDIKKKLKTKKGHWYLSKNKKGELNKSVVKTTDKKSLYVQDDQGNRKFIPRKNVVETVSGAGPASSGASAYPLSEPENLEDLNFNFKKKKASQVLKDKKTSRNKRNMLRQYIYNKTKS